MRLDDCVGSLDRSQQYTLCRLSLAVYWLHHYLHTHKFIAVSTEVGMLLKYNQKQNSMICKPLKQTAYAMLWQRDLTVYLKTLILNLMPATCLRKVGQDHVWLCVASPLLLPIVEAFRNWRSQMLSFWKRMVSPFQLDTVLVQKYFL